MAMTEQKIIALYTKKNLIEVLGNTLIGLDLLINETPRDTQQEFNADSDGVGLRALLTARDLVKGKLIDIIK